jgi:hypothetical protein
LAGAARLPEAAVGNPVVAAGGPVDAVGDPVDASEPGQACSVASELARNKVVAVQQCVQLVESAPAGWQEDPLILQWP